MGPRFHRVEEVRAALGDRVVDDTLAMVALSDAPGDALAAALRARPGGWALLDRALDGSLEEAPAALAPHLDAVVGPAREPPAWVDLELVDAGAVATWRTGAAWGALTLTCGSLAFGYRSAALARPLAMTGRMTQMAPRRLAETSRWYVTATRPGALRPGGAGIRATVRLRLVHALVRAHLRPGWDVGAWGEPLCVADTLATGLGGFFLVPRHAQRDLGIRHRAEELEAMFALWRWVCFLVGVPERWLPPDREAAEDWLAATFALDSGPHEQSPELMRALLRHGYAFERFLPAPAAVVSRTASEQVLGAFTRRWMGDEMADRLGVPDTALKHVAPLLRPLAAARRAVLATGVAGSEAQVAALELALVDVTLRLLRAAPEAIGPERVAAA